MEICVDCTESALNAVSSGAHRLELCSALSEGGLTPSLGLFEVLKTKVSVPIFVMLRPRGGNDFQFSDLEIKVVLQDLASFKVAKADGFVFGALNAERDLDVNACASVILAAHPLPVTFHRAFDVATTSPIEMARKIADLGFKRLLTSGRAATAIDGKLLIKNLIESTKDCLTVIPGAGINVENLEDILVTTLAKEFHGSAKTLKPRANTINVELDSNNKEAQPYITDSEIVKKLLDIYQNHLKLN